MNKSLNRHNSRALLYKGRHAPQFRKKISKTDKVPRQKSLYLSRHKDCTTNNVSHCLKQTKLKIMILEDKIKDHLSGQCEMDCHALSQCLQYLETILKLKIKDPDIEKSGNKLFSKFTSIIEKIYYKTKNKQNSFGDICQKNPPFNHNAGAECSISSSTPSYSDSTLTQGSSKASLSIIRTGECRSHKGFNSNSLINMKPKETLCDRTTYKNLNSILKNGAKSNYCTEDHKIFKANNENSKFNKPKTMKNVQFLQNIATNKTNIELTDTEVSENMKLFMSLSIQDKVGLDATYVDSIHINENKTTENQGHSSNYSPLLDKFIVNCVSSYSKGNIRSDNKCSRKSNSTKLPETVGSNINKDVTSQEVPVTDISQESEALVDIKKYQNTMRRQYKYFKINKIVDQNITTTADVNTTCTAGKSPEKKHKLQSDNTYSKYSGISIDITDNDTYVADNVNAELVNGDSNKNTDATFMTEQQNFEVNKSNDIIVNDPNKSIIITTEKHVTNFNKNTDSFFEDSDIIGDDALMTAQQILIVNKSKNNIGNNANNDVDITMTKKHALNFNKNTVSFFNDSNKIIHDTSMTAEHTSVISNNEDCHLEHSTKYSDELMAEECLSNINYLSGMKLTEISSTLQVSKADMKRHSLELVISTSEIFNYFYIHQTTAFTVLPDSDDQKLSMSIEKEMVVFKENSTIEQLKRKYENVNSIVGCNKYLEHRKRIAQINNELVSPHITKTIYSYLHYCYKSPLILDNENLEQTQERVFNCASEYTPNPIAISLLNFTRDTTKYYKQARDQVNKKHISYNTNVYVPTTRSLYEIWDNSCSQQSSLSPNEIECSQEQANLYYNHKRNNYKSDVSAENWITPETFYPNNTPHINNSSNNCKVNIESESSEVSIKDGDIEHNLSSQFSWWTP